jgi:hypothetical protein
MINCNLEVVNSVKDNNHYNVKYIPFSISTIKLLIQNNENFKVKVIIKPVRFQNDDNFNGGFDDDNNGLKIMWGGGQENGIEFISSPDENKFLFLFVSHTGTFDKLLNYDLTLQFTKEKIDSDIMNITDKIYIKLHPIQNTPLIQNIIHQKLTEKSRYTEFTFDGDLVGYYYPRWYPELFDEISDDTDNYYQSEPLIRNISFKIFKKYQNSDKDQIVLNYKDNEIAVIEGDMDGASYQIESFRFNSSLVIRLWLLWVSKNQFRNRINLEPLQKDKEKKGLEFFNNPELPDLERFDIVISSDGKILAVCTDFHWQEYWYKKRENNENITGSIVKAVHPPDDTLARLLNRHFVDNNYKDIISNLKTITSPNQNKNPNSQMIYCKGEELEVFIQKRKKEEAYLKATNIFRSHVPYITNSDIFSNMISHIVVDPETKKINSMFHSFISILQSIFKL